MKLFISKDVFKYAGKEIQMEALDKGQRTQITIPHVVKKEDGSKEITPFEFRLPIKMHKLQKMRNNNILLDFLRVDSNKNEDEFQANEEGNEKQIYALLHYDEVEPSELYIPTELKDRIKILYKIRFYHSESEGVEHEVKFFLLQISLRVGENIPIYLSYELKSRLDKYLSFERDICDKLDVKEFNTYMYISYKNEELYLPLSMIEGITI